MKSIQYPLIEDEKTEKETYMISENTEKTLGENIEENKKNLAKSENPEQLRKHPDGNKERFSPEGDRFLQAPPSIAGICAAQPAKDGNCIPLLKNIIGADPGKERKTKRKREEFQAAQQVAIHRHHKRGHHIHPPQAPR